MNGYKFILSILLAYAGGIWTMWGYRQTEIDYATYAIAHCRGQLAYDVLEPPEMDEFAFLK